MAVSYNFIQSSLKKLEKWVEDHNYKGYDPADGLDILSETINIRQFVSRSTAAAAYLAKPHQSPSAFRC